MWQVTSERWHVADDTWQVTGDTWCGVTLLSKLKLSSSNSIGVMMFWRSGGNGSRTVCRTAPAPPGLVNIDYCGLIQKSQFQYKNWNNDIKFQFSLSSTVEYSPVYCSKGARPDLISEDRRWHQWPIYIVKCTVSVQCRVYSLQISWYQWTLNSVYTTVYSVQCSVYNLRYTVYSVQCTVQYTF